MDNTGGQTHFHGKTMNATSIAHLGSPIFAMKLRQFPARERLPEFLMNCGGVRCGLTTFT